MNEEERIAEIREGIKRFSGERITEEQLINDYISFCMTGKRSPTMAFIYTLSQYYEVLKQVKEEVKLIV